MAKKSKRTAQPRNPTSSRDIDRWLAKATQHLLQADYERVIATAQRVLQAPVASQQHRIEALDRLGAAYSMQQRYFEAYTVTTMLVALAPQDAMYWYNRGIAARFTMRIGQSLRDLERAQELDNDSLLADRLAKDLPFARDAAEQSRVLRGPDFTLDQLIEQEELFQQAVEVMAAHRWADAETMLRRVIAIGDVLPQPWGNLGLTLIISAASTRPRPPCVVPSRSTRTTRSPARTLSGYHTSELRANCRRCGSPVRSRARR
ncbi:MAG: tetratricopeptide repeat protein [Oscillochloris sp.]|nr:tetratricopeptide repeat protein [Oscillochloris sp.]